MRQRAESQQPTFWDYTGRPVNKVNEVNLVPSRLSPIAIDPHACPGDILGTGWLAGSPR